MKYKIKVVEYASGDTLYYPCYRVCGIWFKMKEYIGYGLKAPVYFESLEECQKYIKVQRDFDYENKLRTKVVHQYDVEM